MNNLHGFFDCNVIVNGNAGTLKNTFEALLNLGYNTVALNVVLDNSIFAQKKKKKKGNASQETPTDIVPAPPHEDLIRTFTSSLQILRRLTVTMSEQLDAHKLSQSSNAKKYDILAVIPTTQAAFQYACSAMDVDIISFDPQNKAPVKLNRKLYNLATERGTYFELMYTPAIRDATARKNIIQMAHLYHALGKSKNIIISSGANTPLQVRGPYDIINLGFLFGLSQEQAKNAVTTTCRSLLIKARGRRFGKTVVIVDQKQHPEREEEKERNVSNENDEMECDVEQPVVKRSKMET